MFSMNIVTSNSGEIPGFAAMTGRHKDEAYVAARTGPGVLGLPATAFRTSASWSAARRVRSAGEVAGLLAAVSDPSHPAAPAHRATVPPPRTRAIVALSAISAISGSLSPLPEGMRPRPEASARGGIGKVKGGKARGPLRGESTDS